MLIEDEIMWKEMRSIANFSAINSTHNGLGLKPHHAVRCRRIAS